MNLIKKVLAAQAAVLALWAVGAQAASDDAIAERLKPVGEVCIAGQECKGVGAVAAAAGGGARSADDVVAKYCGACHSAGVLGAPKIGDAADWKARASERGGIDALLKSAIAGRNAMPPKGTCADCSDDELLGAIHKMAGM
ncbi:Cytochrome c5 [Pseudomonas sp. OF001]|uniref:c-type cytochrome n=1 Tax=unclassified Pseudomonas TaxID=196821 RepID=UPI0019189928|nr:MULTISPECIES: c-type cytochrome [unclassified Pseudomonas]WPP44691.1 c-type cytochrome [Pseudomonas sp. AN-1]CAD5375862.1 Cytochrome c5 [Pseudomonas sp. OF001]